MEICYKKVTKRLFITHKRLYNGSVCKRRMLLWANERELRPKSVAFGI